jgi:hypothetical protein
MENASEIAPRSISGEFAARNSMSGAGESVVIPTRFTEDVRAYFRAQNRLDFCRIVRIAMRVGRWIWPTVGALRARPAMCGALGRASVNSGAANQRGGKRLAFMWTRAERAERDPLVDESVGDLFSLLAKKIGAALVDKARPLFWGFPRGPRGSACTNYVKVSRDCPVKFA